MFGAMNLAAAIDDDHFADDGERILLVSTNSVIPEVTVPVDRVDGVDPLLTRFDRVVHYNDLIAPFHPSTFTRVGEPAVAERWLRGLLDLADEPVHLILESIQVPPSQTLAQVFETSPITMYSDGLMSYGPTRVQLPAELGERITGLSYLDLVPGLSPMLLREFDVASRPIADQSFRAVVDEVAAALDGLDDTVATLPTTGRVGLVLGQYLAALGLMSHGAEAELYASMVTRLAELGCDHVVFKPHPTAPPATRDALAAAADGAGIAFSTLETGLSVEVLLARWSPAVVSGCFSTGMVVAERFFGVPIAAGGTAPMMRNLKPFENSNRMPLVLTDQVVPRIDEIDDIATARPPCTDGADPALGALVDAVSFAMQPQIHAARRDDTIAYLRSLTPSARDRYFHPSRLADLGLPGAAPSLRWRAKSTVAGISEGTARFGQRFPTAARPLREFRRLLTPPVEWILDRVPGLRRLAKRLARQATANNHPA